MIPMPGTTRVEVRTLKIGRYVALEENAYKILGMTKSTIVFLLAKIDDKSEDFNTWETYVFYVSFVSLFVLALVTISFAVQTTTMEGNWSQWRFLPAWFETW